MVSWEDIAVAIGGFTPIIFVGAIIATQELFRSSSPEVTPCDVCGNVELNWDRDWYVPDEEWRQVVPEKWQESTLCPWCFVKFAAARGKRYEIVWYKWREEPDVALGVRKLGTTQGPHHPIGQIKETLTSFVKCARPVIWREKLVLVGCNEVSELTLRALRKMGFKPVAYVAFVTNYEGKEFAHTWVEVDGYVVETNPSQIWGLRWEEIPIMYLPKDVWMPERKPRKMEVLGNRVLVPTPVGEEYYNGLAEEIVRCMHAPTYFLTPRKETPYSDVRACMHAEGEIYLNESVHNYR